MTYGLVPILTSLEERYEILFRQSTARGMRQRKGIKLQDLHYLLVLIFDIGVFCSEVSNHASPHIQLIWSHFLLHMTVFWKLNYPRNDSVTRAVSRAEMTAKC